MSAEGKDSFHQVVQVACSSLPTGMQGISGWLRFSAMLFTHMLAIVGITKCHFTVLPQ